MGTVFKKTATKPLPVAQRSSSAKATGLPNGLTLRKNAGQHPLPWVKMGLTD